MMSTTARDFPVRVLHTTRSAVAINGPGGPDCPDGIAALLALAVRRGVADYAGVTECDPHLPGSFTTVAPTHDLVRRLDRRQLQHQQGPFRDTRTQFGVVSSSDVGSDARWPRWGPAAASLGVGSVMSVALRGRGMFGAVTFYRASPATPSAEHLAQAAVIGTSISIVLANRRARTPLTAAARARDRIGQAQGVFMQQHDLTADQALDMLSRLCRDNNVTLADLAGSVVDGVAS